MADNTALEAVVTTGDTLQTDDMGTYKIPGGKITLGADGVNDGYVASGNPLPMNIQSSTIDVMLGSDFSAVFGSASLVATDGSAALSIGLQAMGTDGLNAQTLSTNTSGHLNIADGGNNISVDLNGINPSFNAGNADAGTQRVVLATDQAVVSVDDNGGSLTIDAASLPLPSGASTAANQSTANTSLGNIDTNTGNTDTNTTDLPNVIGTDGLAGPSRALSMGGTESGGALQELRVDSDGHLQVDVLSGGGGAGQQYQVNDPAGATDTGTLSLVVRDDALTTLTPPDGDYVQMRTNSQGALWVQHDGVLSVDDNGGSLTIDASSLPLPTGAATETTLSAVDTNTTNIPNVIGSDGAVGPSSALSIAGTESGGTLQELRVDSDGHLQVDILSGGAGTGTEYTEDAAAPANPDAGALSLVRQDTPATLTSADGDWVTQRATNYGAAFVQLLTSSGSFIDSIGGGTEYTEDAAAPADPLGKATALVRADTPATIATADGDWVAQRATNYGAAYCQLVTSSGSFIDSIGGGTEYTEDDAAPANPIGKASALVRADTPATVASADGDIVAQRATNYGAAYVQLVTSAGAFIDSIGGGTEFAVDSVAGASDLGKLTLAVRDDALTTLTPADGDYTQLRTNNRGAMWVEHDGNLTVDAGSGWQQAVTEDAAAAGAESGPYVMGQRRDADTSPVSADGDYHGFMFDNAGALKVNVKAGSSAGTEYTEDAASPADPDAPAVALVRQDTPATISTTDGDWVTQRATNYGAAYCQLLTSSGSFIDSVGGGTEYTEDDAAPANPIGKAAALVRADTPATIASADGDIVAQRATNYGAAYCQLVTSAGAFIDSVGGGTEFNVDSAAGASDAGKLVLAVRDDTLATLTPVDGDYVQFRTNNRGAQWVQHDGVLSVDDNGGNLSIDLAGTNPTLNSGAADAGTQRVTVATDDVVSIDDNGGSLTVDSGAAFTVQEDGAALTALQKIDNLAHSGADVALVEHLPISGQLDDTATTTVTENNIAPVRITSARALHVAQQGVVSIDDNSGSITVDDGGVNLSVDLNGQNPTFNTGAADAGTLRVTVATGDTVTVDNGGTFAVQEDGAALTALQKLDNIAHSGSDVALVEHVPISGQLDDTATTTVTENQIAPVRITSARALHVTQQGDITLAAGTNNIGDVDVLSLPELPAGTNNIGDVDVASLPSLPAGTNNIGDVDVLTQPARDRLTDNMGVALQTDRILSDTTALTPQFAAINASSSGDNTLVAAGTNKIRVLACMLIAAGDVDARFESGAGGAALSGVMDLTTNSGFTLPFNPVGWCETASATLLNLELSAAVQVSGFLVYIDVA